MFCQKLNFTLNNLETKNIYINFYSYTFLQKNCVY